MKKIFFLILSANSFFRAESALDFLKAYQKLCIPFGSSLQEIDKAFKKKAMAAHPDIKGTKFNKEMQELNEARSFLKKKRSPKKSKNLMLYNAKNTFNKALKKSKPFRENLKTWMNERVEMGEIRKSTEFGETIKRIAPRRRIIVLGLVFATYAIHELKPAPQYVINNHHYNSKDQQTS